VCHCLLAKQCEQPAIHNTACEQAVARDASVAINEGPNIWCGQYSRKISASTFRKGVTMTRLRLLTLVAILSAYVLSTNIAYAQFDDFGDFGSNPSGSQQPPFEGFGANEPWERTPIPLPPLSREEESRRESLLQKLERPVSLSERTWTLQAVLDSIEQQIFMEIAEDVSALREYGIEPELELIDIPSYCRRLPARTVLDFFMLEVGLVWVLEQERVLITTADQAESKMIVRQFDVTDLVISAATDDGRFEVEYFLDLIPFTIEPDAWESWGGPGIINAETVNGRSILKIQQYQSVFEQIEDVLTELRRLNVPASVRPLPSWVDNDAHVLRLLEKQMETDYQGTPLKDLVEDVVDVIKVPVFFHVSLLDWGVDPELEPVDLDSCSMSVDDALDVVLSSIGLTYGWREGALWITTYDGIKYEEFMEARVYDVSNLLVDNEDVGPLIDLITETVEPESWDSWGGPGTISEAELEHSCFLVIRQTWKKHRLVEQLLGELEMASFVETVEDDPQWPHITYQIKTERTRAIQMNAARHRERAIRAWASPVRTESEADPFDQTPTLESPFPEEPNMPDPFAQAP
jgi:hypothetical protein